LNGITLTLKELKEIIAKANLGILHSDPKDEFSIMRDQKVTLVQHHYGVSVDPKGSEIVMQQFQDVTSPKKNNP
jgi:hypothetical protein